MKFLFFHFVFLFLSNFSFSQKGENPLPFVEHEPQYDTAPQFPGGAGALIKYFQDSIRYPEPEKSKRMQGNVLLKFQVTKEGKIINVEAINGVAGAPNLLKEAIRLVQSMPAWKPATKKGKPVDADYTMGVPFRL